MLPKIQPDTFKAHLQKFVKDVILHDGQITPSEMLLFSMADNREMAKEILLITRQLCDTDATTDLALVLVTAVYQALKAQDESNRMEVEGL